jgi:hypothetical protein
MTARTRRRLIFCVVLAAIALPVELLLLPVARTPNAGDAAVRYVSSLSASELQQATSRIDQYPALYRRALMGALTAEDRARVWRSQFQKFLDVHQELTSEQRAVVTGAMALITAEAFQPPLSTDLQAKITAAFDQATKVLPGQAAKELFVTLGPKEPANASALPLSERLANRVRAWRVASADGGDCNCNVEIDTCDIWPEPDWLQCSELYTCDMDLSWPMCGPLWSWACTGWCRVLIFEGGPEI